MAANGKVYAIGGYSNGTYYATVEEYDPATNTWATRTSIPTARQSVAAATAGNGRIHAVGGETSARSNLATNEKATIR